MEEGSVATSDDDVDENLPPRRGRGRGSSSGRGRGLKRPAAAAKAPKVQKTVAKGANKRPKVIDARSQMPDDNDDRCQMSEGDASTSESEETKRIAKAEAIWKPRPAKDDECEVSSEECEGNADLKSSTLLSFLTWTMEKVLKPEEINAFKQAPDLALGELCAGMATATIALQALELKLQEVHQIPLKCQQPSTQSRLSGSEMFAALSINMLEVEVREQKPLCCGGQQTWWAAPKAAT